uniref:Olfactory receptor n=1 Tax=Lepisosteus oculatus TaxID=7918 RepID=W5NNT7_LEPOC
RGKMTSPPNVTVLLLTGYEEMGSMKYLYFVLIFVAFLVTIFLNGFLILVVYLKENLHKPMYIFLSNLFVNGLYLSVALYPQILSNLLSDVQMITRFWCQFQVFCLHNYVCCECTILTVMGYDRFVSICMPLQYHSIMTPGTVSKLVAFAWLFPVLILSGLLGLTSRVPLCGNTIGKVYCDNWSIVRLSCTDTTKENTYGIFASILFPGIPVLLVVLSYQRILRACLKASKEARGKALTTCLPHIITFLKFCINVLFEVISRRLDNSSVPLAVRTFLSLQLFIVPPLLNPLVYGLRLQEMRSTVEKVFLRHKSAVQHN